MSIPSDHLEHFSRGLSTITVDPVKNVLYYFFPLVGVFFSEYQELKVDLGASAMMPQAPTELMLREIKELTGCAGILREVSTYIALNHQFASFGGPYSLTTPALLLPDQHLFRRNGLPPFCAERAADNLADQRWVFSDNETRFLIARELGQIGTNNSLLRIAIKVCLLAAIFSIYTISGGLVLATPLLLSALGMYIYTEKHLHTRADIDAIDILRQKRIANPFQVAINTLEKMRQQNLYRRENSWVARLYITQSGNNVLDFVHPYLTTRLENVRTCARNS